jgi:hypothetical protein
VCRLSSSQDTVSQAHGLSPQVLLGACHRAGSLGGGVVDNKHLSIGTAVRCLFALADPEARQHESLLNRQGLPPMDPSARSQYRAICYQQLSARIGHAVAKASVMRILRVPRLPLQQSIPSALLAGNCPGQADSFSFPLRFLPLLPSTPFISLLFPVPCPFTIMPHCS